jgi:hypothetical protein
MTSNPKQLAGPPMTLGNMRQLGVRGLAVHCLNPTGTWLCSARTTTPMKFQFRHSRRE